MSADLQRAPIASSRVSTGRAVPALTVAEAEAGILPRLRTVALSQPDAVAVADAGGELTYVQVAVQAAATLAAVRVLALPDGAPVCLLHSHTRGAVSALLGIVASGHPVLVLDPRTPAPRLRQFAERVGATACVADPSTAATAGQVVEHVLAAPGQDASADPEALWADPPDPGRPAALAFTSGSTGTPKAVINDHRMLVRDAWTNSIGTGCYGADDVVAHSLPLAFHAGLMVTVAGLMVGSRMELYDVRGSGIGGLPGWLERVGATVMHSSPAILRAFVGTGPRPEQLAGLRSLTIAGEAAHGRDVEAARALLPAGCVVRNRYGSSETGLIAEYPVDSAHPPLDGPLPVGRPVGDTVLTVVGEGGAPLPPGEPGVLTVTTRYTASGYWDDPDATAAAFTQNPDGTRTYRSSDVGVLDPALGGNLRLLGRRDHSVKVRGYLVEPGEVDAALFALPDVREAVTVGAPRPGDGGTRLVAYVVSTAEQPSAAAVRAALRQSLPGHMVPEIVLFLDALPRTERGKLDRSALPEPPAVGAPVDAPMTDWERVVSVVWARALELDSVGPDDDFFELGGDSLAAEGLLSMVVSDLGVPADDVTSSVLVEAPTVRSFAQRLHRKPDALGAELTPLQREGSAPPLFFVAGGGGLGVAFVPVARRLGPDQPSWALQTHAMERRGIPDWTVRGAARRQIRTMRAVQPHGPYHLAGHSFGGLVALEMAHQLRAAGEQVALLAILDSYPPKPELHPADPPGPFAQRVKERIGMLGTGILTTPGTGHYWRFYRLATAMGRRYRCAPWPGRTVVLVADSEDRAVRAQWAEHLSGDWELVDVGGDHLSMLRDPHAGQVAEALAKALAALPGR